MKRSEKSEKKPNDKEVFSYDKIKDFYLRCEEMHEAHPEAEDVWFGIEASSGSRRSENVR